MFTLTLKPSIWKFHLVIWQTTSKNCTEVRAARAARIFFLIQPIRSLFFWRRYCCCRRPFLSSLFTPTTSGFTLKQMKLERFSIAFTANGKRQAEISRLPKTREIYLVSAYILPVSHSYGASTENREIS